MYCSSCGAAVTQGLSYCNRCGNNLSLVRGDGTTKPRESPAAIGVDIFWTTVFGLALIFGGTVALKAFDLREALIIAYMVLSSLAFVGLYVMDLWRFIRFYRSSQGMSATAQVEKFDTKELRGAGTRVLPEPASSVTDNTTRSLEPSYRQQKAQ
jgi:hypothetical protein